MITLYQKLTAILENHIIDELGLVFGLPKVDELPSDSQPYYPLIFIESKLGFPFQHYNDLIRETDQAMRETTSLKAKEQASKIMIMLKPDNYTAMNLRKQFIKSGQITIKDEIHWIDLIFTIQKHCKSGVAWHHRQWLFMHPDAIDYGMDLDHELQLCARTATLHPRNYYAWNYRRWLLYSYMDTNLLREKEYKESREWVEQNVSDYSGVHHLSCVVKCLVRHGFDNFEEHLGWTKDLIVQYPGHEALWYHLRFCYTFFTNIKTDGHCIIERIINNNDTKEVEKKQNRQLELALCFGIWLCLLEKRSESKSFRSIDKQQNDYTARLHKITSIPKYISI
ncbi:hypothetical protein BDA99DRAFT_562884 [Phascolomyces articulosus]|uniref:Uncharacterized protein n=1 Tax=Phascolomyces articulosus TaxID=60185 RepID=A0AAD5K4K9_9FUNG|nr:hypothetical protein BDA99DRAFT_562884 [Phascolomyces articulosus]